MPYFEIVIAGLTTLFVLLVIELVRCIRDIRRDVHKLEINQALIKERIEQGYKS